MRNRKRAKLVFNLIEMIFNDLQIYVKRLCYFETSSSNDYSCTKRSYY